MNKKSLFCCLLAAGILASSCSLDERDDAIVDDIFDNVNTESMLKGTVSIKVSEELAEILEAQTDTKGLVRSVGVKSSDDILSGINVLYMERTFPIDPRFEERTRREGLHLWYDVYFDDSVELTKASHDISEIEGVNLVEYRRKIKGADYSYVTEGQMRKLEASLQKEGETSIKEVFNDPYSNKQWHYYNDGSYPYKAVAGCDVNVLPAWKQGHVGSEDVIVAVIDQGVDWSHLDLKDNMWVNEAEMNGNPGSDDDGNGYADDIYGFNFVDMNGDISAGEHGTHVAGTIGAVNNNGLGVCGIAGGDLANGIKGCRIMSVELLASTDGKGGGDVRRAMQYAANNGAVIAQNSWGYEDEHVQTMPQAEKEAIDYFIKYAGCDNSGNQTGPMKGGLVIFAAGNQNRDYDFPSQYEPVIAVASVAADYEKASYSCYGPWVDIAAPGGEQIEKNQLIYSTVPHNKYQSFQGTSMACPHVSGVAALIVSKMKGPGLTPDTVREMLIESTTPIDAYNPGFRGWLGKGLVNAFEALSGASTIPPDPITDLKAEGLANNIKISFTVPKDEDNIIPSTYKIYFSSSKFSKDIDVNNVPSYINVEIVPNGAAKAGDKFEYILSHESLDFSKEYYLSAIAMDRAKNHSAMSDVLKVSTTENHAPYFEPADDININIASHETTVVKVQLIDPDFHECSIKLDTDETKVISAKKSSDGTVQITIDGKKSNGGNEFKGILTGTDAYGMSSSLNIKALVSDNHAPELIGTIDDIVFASTGLNKTIDLTTIFKDEDNEKLMYRITMNPTGIANITFSGDKMLVKAVKYGTTEVSLLAKDAANETVETKFKVLVADPNKKIDIFPNPVVDIVNLRTVIDIQNATIHIYNANGAEVFQTENATISSFAPYQIDMTGMSAGVYRIKIVYAEGEIEDSIIKL